MISVYLLSPHTHTQTNNTTLPLSPGNTKVTHYTPYSHFTFGGVVFKLYNDNQAEQTTNTLANQPTPPWSLAEGDALRRGQRGALRCSYRPTLLSTTSVYRRNGDGYDDI